MIILFLSCYNSKYRAIYASLESKREEHAAMYTSAETLASIHFVRYKQYVYVDHGVDRVVEDR
jgi:hypothetical protein